MDDTSPTEPISVLSFGRGRYVARARLGEGGQKSVYLVRDTALSRDCALSLLTADFDPESRDRLEREARTIAGLGVHPNVVTVFDIGEDEGRPYIVSEYVAGGDLAAELRRTTGGLPLERALCVAKDVTRAVAFVHRASVIHRDLKPGNIWLTPEGIAKLGDFGLALGAGFVRVTAPETAFGTAAYMPPEQALAGELDHRSDLYSLGCLIYQLVTGRTPFQSDNSVALISQHVNLAPPPPSRINSLVTARLERMILKLLAKSRIERPESAEEVLGELEAIEAEMAGGGTSPGQVRVIHPLHGLSRLVFAGRNRELQALREGLEKAIGGQGGLFMISGEAGIGKSRLSQELGLYGQMRGAKVVTGRCSEEASAPYQPFVEVLDALVGTEKTRDIRRVLGDDVAILARFLPRFAKRLRSPEALRTPDESERYLLFQAVVQLLTHFARDAGLILILEDLHWVDTATANLLRHLAYRLSDTRLLVVGIYRDVEPGHPLTQTISELRREHLFERIRLGSLNADEVRTLLSGAEGSLVPDAFVKAMQQLTEGNPFFIEEVLRHLAQVGRIRWREGRLEIDDFDPRDLQVPEAVRDLVALRLMQISEPCRDFLRLSSALTGAVGWELLTNLTDVPGEALSDLIDEALRAQFIEEARDSGDRFNFKHALVRQALYESVSGIRRAGIHKRIAEALEAAVDEDKEGLLSEIAHHYFRAVNLTGPEKAIDFLVRAAGRSRRVFANEDAILHLTRAAELAEAHASENARLPDILLSLGEALELTGNYMLALEKYQSVIDHCADPRAYRGEVSTLRRLGEYERAIEVAQNALGRPEVTGVDAAALWLEYGWTLSVTGMFAKAIEVLEAAVDLTGPAERIRGELLLQIARARTETGDPGQALVDAEQAEEIFAQRKDLMGLATALRIKGEALFRLERLPEAKSALEEGLEIAERLGEIEEVGGCLVNLGIVLFQLGLVEEAIACQSRAAEVFGGIRHGSGVAAAYTNLAEIFVRTGRFDEALSYCEALLRHSRALGHQPTIADGLRISATVHLQKGQFAKAARLAAKAERLYEQMGMPAEVGECRDLLSDAERLAVRGRRSHRV